MGQAGDQLNIFFLLFYIVIFARQACFSHFHACRQWNAYSVHDWRLLAGSWPLWFHFLHYTDTPYSPIWHLRWSFFSLGFSLWSILFFMCNMIPPLFLFLFLLHISTCFFICLHNVGSWLLYPGIWDTNESYSISQNVCKKYSLEVDSSSVQDALAELTLTSMLHQLPCF